MDSDVNRGSLVPFMIAMAAGIVLGSGALAVYVKPDVSGWLAFGLSPEEHIAKCDSLAGHPSDRDKVGAGVANREFNPQAAAESCLEGLAASPGNRRVAFQVGRVLVAGGRLAEARDPLIKAADLGSAAAKTYLARLVAEGKAGFDQDVGIAYSLLEEALDGGFSPARKDLKALVPQLVQICDTVAAHPDDPAKPRHVPGVPDNALNGQAAIDACAPVVEKIPNEARYRFQLARGLLAAGQQNEANDQIKLAANAGHAGGLAYLADELANKKRAKELYQQSAQLGFSPAKAVLERIRAAELQEQELAKKREKNAERMKEQCLDPQGHQIPPKDCGPTEAEITAALKLRMQWAEENIKGFGGGQLDKNNPLSALGVLMRGFGADKMARGMREKIRAQKIGCKPHWMYSGYLCEYWMPADLIPGMQMFAKDRVVASSGRFFRQGGRWMFVKAQ